MKEKDEVMKKLKIIEHKMDALFRSWIIVMFFILLIMITLMLQYGL
ncbi:hypothetical protein LCGC14_0863000 [marine sediment metagenome]|uniref:Uncharacterized protein n=1 Tax=marine sediment metagenome TaxID=412755 RepID=A0A0F9SDZ5_9ZZZZ